MKNDLISISTFKVKRILLLFTFTALVLNIMAQLSYDPSDPEYYAMDRQQINFDDQQVLLFNHRGYVSPRQYSITGFTRFKFLPFKSDSYNFNMNTLVKNKGILLRDDVPQIMNKWIRERVGYDPLGTNQWPFYGWNIITQDEKWQPNAYFSSGTFHKKIEGEWISFSQKSTISVSYNDDEVFIKMVMGNRGETPLHLTLVPLQTAREMICDGMLGSDSARQIDAFTYGSEQMHARVSSNIETSSENGFELTLEPGEYVTSYFSVKFYRADEKAPEIFQEDIKSRMNRADQVTREKLKWAYDRLPKLESSNAKVQEYYYRCMLSVLMCRYENPDFIINPFWAVGTLWVYTIGWDTSHSSDILAMLEPESLKEAILTTFRVGKMEFSWIGYKGYSFDCHYPQEPYYLMTMIESYLRHTGDYSIFSEKAGDATLWEWMNRWTDKLRTDLTNSEGLIDVGHEFPGVQWILEIRTDDYYDVIPAYNILTMNLLYRMSEWAGVLKEPNREQYFKDAEQLKKLVNNKLWNKEKGWFDHLYQDGSKKTVWSYHMYDALTTTDCLTGDQVIGLLSHLREGVFLGKFGTYSQARRDSVHWDLLDADFGGGGQYAGMCGKISENVYKYGFPELGWNILSRHMGYIDYFPYLPQNPRTDTPENDRFSMPVELASGAGMEAIIFGTFGITIDNNRLFISPNTHRELGNTILRDFKFRGKTYDIQIREREFSVYCNGKHMTTRRYGEKVVFE